MSEDKNQDNKVIAAGHNIYGVDSIGLYLPGILKYHLDTKSSLEVKYADGMLTEPLENLFALLEKNGAKLGLKIQHKYTYLWDNSFIVISKTNKNNEISLAAYLTDPKLVELFSFIEKSFISKSKKDLVFSIIKSTFGLEIKNLGNGASPLIKENYNPQVIDELNYVIDTFKKTPPPGRICILNGEPGTGKTHLVRSFLSEIDCVYLIVPSSLISSLDSPDFLPLLLRVKESYEKPIILIIEDGDTCLVPRKSDNMSTITSLLNLSDGILGSIIDIKMIITTNALIKDVDQAILRVGRLCKNIHVGPLPYDQANKVYHKLMGKEDVFLEKRKFYTLAEVYNCFYNKDSNQPMISKTKSIGFSFNDSYPKEGMPEKIEVLPEFSHLLNKL